MLASVHQLNGQKYHSQILTTINSPKSPGNLRKLNLETITVTAPPGGVGSGSSSAHGGVIGSGLMSNPSFNLTSAIHLPPLQTLNPARFPERQRRTQLLQRQRLRKEFFH
jgi:hypothetical protein